MKETAYGEMYLWNRGVDRLVRVLQRLETAGIIGKQERESARNAAGRGADGAERGLCGGNGEAGAGGPRAACEAASGLGEARRDVKECASAVSIAQWKSALC